VNEASYSDLACMDFDTLISIYPKPADVYPSFCDDRQTTGKSSCKQATNPIPLVHIAVAALCKFGILHLFAWVTAFMHFSLYFLICYM